MNVKNYAVLLKPYKHQNYLLIQSKQKVKISTVYRLFTSLFSNTLFVYYGFGPWTFIDYIKFERGIVNSLLNI